MKELLEWFSEEIKSIFMWVLEGLLDAFVSLIDLIPVPDWLSDIGTLTLPSNILYYTTLFQVHVGIGIMVSAYVIRFIIRRLPVVG